MELLFEPSKRLTLFGLFIMGIIGTVFSYVPCNSKFLEPLFECAMPSIVNMIVLSIGFLTLAISSILMYTVPKREQKWLSMKSQRKDDRSFDLEKIFNKKYTRLEKSRGSNKKLTIFFAMCSIISFLFVFFTGPLVYTITELNKPLIEKTISDFRLYMDILCWLSFVISLVGFFISSPFVIRNRKFNSVIMKILIGTNVISIAHFTYFCLGHFTNYPSIEDGMVAFTSLLFAILSYLSLATEKKKITLKEWNDTKMMIYDF